MNIMSSKKKLKKCCFYSCNKAAVAQATPVTVQRHGGKTNTNKYFNSRAEVFQQFSQNSNYVQHHVVILLSRIKTYLKLPVYTLTGNSIRYASEFFLRNTLKKNLCTQSAVMLT